MDFPVDCPSILYHRHFLLQVMQHLCSQSCQVHTYTPPYSVLPFNPFFFCVTSFLFFRETNRTKIGLPFFFPSPTRCTTRTSAGVISAPTALKISSTFCSVSPPPPLLPSPRQLGWSLFGCTAQVDRSHAASEGRFFVGSELPHSAQHSRCPQASACSSRNCPSPPRRPERRKSQ